MRILAIAVVFLNGLGVSGLLAQRAPTVSPSGFGRMMFPGGGPPGAYAGAAAAGMYGTVSAPVLPTPRNNSVRPNAPTDNRRNRGNNQTAVVPFPVYVGGGNGGYYDPYMALGQGWPTPGQPGFSTSSYAQPVSAPASQAAAPSHDASPRVVINQYFQQGTAPASGQTAASADATMTAASTMSVEMQSIFLIAMKDHTIYAANSYWVEDDTLNYITVQGTENSISMDLVDRDLSRRLNRDRKVAFGLPAN